MTRPRSVPRRGYLLAEVMVASAITAVALVALLGQAGDGLVQSTTIARDLTAQGLVNRSFEEIRGLGFAGVTAKAETAVTGVHGEYTRQIKVTTGSEALFGSSSSNYKDVEVIIRRKVAGKTKTYQSQVRVYD